MGVISEWGSTAAERAATFPCDRYLERPTGVCFRAIDIDAPVAHAFRWLCQLRVAPYSYDWIDNGGRRSPRERDPANEDLAVGQRVMTFFRLVEFERDQHITVVLSKSRLFGDVAVTYQLSERSAGGGSRLVVKVLFATPRWSPMGALLPAGDLVMMRKQLLTLKRLAEED